jgi:large subunit ribosomal protein L3
MTCKLMGRKRGMTQRFDETGSVVICTVIEVEPNVITQVKTVERDGYNAIQFGFEQISAGDERTVERRVGKPLAGHFKKAGVAPRRHLMEVWVDSPDEHKVGDEFTVGQFEAGVMVDVAGVSKGRGYQGVMRLHNFSGGPGAHGSGFHRHAGSTGMRSTPGRCFPGGKRPSQMGNRACTVQNLQVELVDPERNLIVIRGAIPGYNGALVTISPAIKKQRQQRRQRTSS